MPVTVSTSAPQALLDAIKKDIKDKKILTWDHIVHKEADYFTHNPAQFNRNAFLKPSVGAKALTFTVIYPELKEPELKELKGSGIYGIYEGRFAEMLLNHYKDKGSFTSIALD